MRYIMILAMAMVCFTSCDDQNRVYEENQDIPNKIWNKDHLVEFSFEVADTTERYNIIVNLRHTNYYLNSNLWVMVYTTYPDGSEQQQRLELSLANEKGEWFGECTGDICLVQQYIQRNAILNQVGTYKLAFEQIMRTDDLAEVLAFGLRVEKVAEEQK